MGRYFGTDGIRGVAGDQLDAGLAFKTGCAAATVLAREDGKRTRVMIAKDTRISCDMLETALAAGLCSAGADVTLLGVLPTPAVAMLTVKSGADVGIVISASHNPYEHNGIKLFGKNGFKLSDINESRIEDLIDDGRSLIRKTHGDIGRIHGEGGYWANEYVKNLAQASKGTYRGRIAIDCANGAASETARMLFRELGAEFEIFFDEPDGININDNCGSTHIERLSEIMRSGRFGIGFAFDGDADRCLVVDEAGNTIDGDIILAVIAREMKASCLLRGSGIVGTVVSNSGMDIFARDNGFGFHRAQVGDRNVLEMMWEHGCNIGGESSGHIVFSDDATTGDGQLTAIKFLNVLSASGKTAAELVSDIPSFPQVMPSYRLTGGAEERDAIMSNPRFREEITRQQKILAGEGRVLVRPSGTESLIRVLVEAKTKELASGIAESLITFMKTL